MSTLRTFIVLAGSALGLSGTACGDQSDRPTGLEPTITQVAPARAGLPGGATATITGGNFLYIDAGEPIVVVGGVEVEATVVDDATITFTVPPGDAAGATVDVAVFNGNGYAIATDAITYNDPPAIFDLGIAHAPAAGGDVLTITGRGFAADAPGATTVAFGAATTDEVLVVDDTTLEVTVPPIAAADATFRPLSLALANANGTATATVPFVYTERALLAFGNNRARRMLVIDPATFNVRDTGLSPPALSSYGVDAEGQAWAVGANPRSLMRFDPFGSSTVVGNLVEAGQDRPTADIVLLDGVAYGYSARQGSRFGSIDLASAEFTTIGASLGLTQGGVSAALAYRNDNSVYFAQRLNEPLRTISVVSGTVSNLVPLDGPSDRMAHGMTLFDNKLFVVAQNNDRTNSWLYEVDPATGTLTERAEFGINISAIGPTPPSFE